MMTGFDKAIVGGFICGLSSLVAAPIDWANPSTLWIPHFLTAFVSGLVGSGFVYVVPNRGVK